MHYAAPPTIGGVEATLAAHARLFARHAYPVKIIAGCGAPFDPHIPLEIIPDADSQSPRVLQVNTELARGEVSPAFHALARDLTRALATALADCDLLIAHNALSLHKNLALTAALRELAGIRLIAWCHDFAWTDPQYAAALYPGLPWDLLRAPWANVTYVVVSRARQIELENLWKSRGDITVIPPGIEPREFFNFAEQTAQWIDQFDLRDAAPLLLLPARITRRKQIERAIEIVAALRARGDAAKLVITGPLGAHNPANAAYWNELRELRRARGVESAVIFLREFGSVEDAVRRDLFLIADALLFPSAREGFGIPILEAALARLPIFCSDLAPFRETARDHAHYFAPDASPAQIAQCITDTLARDHAYRLKQRVVKNYSWDRIFSERIEPLVNKGFEIRGEGFAVRARIGGLDKPRHKGEHDGRRA
ncbi:MAG: glycosyltransferase family 4 protein [Chloroflexi bacterium]|nr:glycosyltransferase family 4 protein [Chloroflexota bacterium]